MFKLIGVNTFRQSDIYREVLDTLRGCSDSDAVKLLREAGMIDSVILEMLSRRWDERG